MIRFGSVKRYFMIDCWLIIGQHTQIHIFHLYPTSVALMVKKMWEVGWFLRKQAIFGAPLLFKLVKSGLRFWIWDILFYLFKASKCDLSIQQSSLSNLFKTACKKFHFLGQLMSDRGSVLFNIPHSEHLVILLVSVQKYRFFIFIPPL
jgi:hypothetical protein